MSEFIKAPANKASLSKRKLIYGVGANDAWYVTQPTINSKKVMCPVYRRWVDMLKRCYSDKLQEKYPTYIGCTVCTEWLTFSVFAKWFKVNNADGFDLDKDLKVKGNKIYCPEMCLFIPQCINKLLTGSGASRGDYPIGVSWDKATGKYLSFVTIDGKNKNLGRFTTPELAHEAYKIAKNAEIMRKCKQYPEFAEYLINHLIT